MAAGDTVLIGQLSKNDDDTDEDEQEIGDASDCIDMTIAQKTTAENQRIISLPPLAAELLSLLLFTFQNGNPDCFVVDNGRNSGNTDHLIHLVSMASQMVKQNKNPVQATLQSLTINAMLFAMNKVARKENKKEGTHRETHLLGRTSQVNEVFTFTDSTRQ